MAMARGRGLHVAQVAATLGVDSDEIEVVDTRDVDWMPVLDFVRDTNAPRDMLRLLGAAVVTAAAPPLAQCRVGGEDMAGLYPVLDDDGLFWECNHPDATHRSEYVKGRQRP